MYVWIPGKPILSGTAHLHNFYGQGFGTCMCGSLANLSLVEQPIYIIFYGQGFGGARKALRNYSCYQ
jgi:hypothetical protein